jgi:hypothetical protein
MGGWPRFYSGSIIASGMKRLRLYPLCFSVQIAWARALGEGLTEVKLANEAWDTVLAYRGTNKLSLVQPAVYAFLLGVSYLHQLPLQRPISGGIKPKIGYTDPATTLTVYTAAIASCFASSAAAASGYGEAIERVRSLYSLLVRRLRYGIPAEGVTDASAVAGRFINL